MIEEKYKGIIVPLVSPCNSEEKLDTDALLSFFGTLVSKSITGMYLCGGTGDAAKLNVEERKEIASLLVPELKKSKKTAIVHVGNAQLQNVCELALHAAKMGADAVASVPPKGSWASCKEYYKELCKVGIPVFMYYFPGATGVQGTFEDLEPILALDGVAGIKVSDWNLFLIRQIKQRYPDIVVYNGFDEMLLPGLLYGADGSIGTWANVFTNLYIKTYALVQKNELTAAKIVSDKIASVLVKGWDYGILPTFEAIMRTKGCAQCFRKPTSWPNVDIPPHLVQSLVQEIDKIETEPLC